MPDDNLPERQLRASDADRDGIVARLREALAEGRLTEAEHSDRLDQLYAAHTHGDLDRVTADLPLPDPAFERRRPVRSAGAAETVAPTFAVFSSATTRPTGAVEGATASIALFGATMLDLRNAVIADSGLVLTVAAVYGSVTVILPTDADVKVLGIPLFGAVHHQRDDAVGAGPLVTVRALALFGAVRIRREPPDPA